APENSERNAKSHHIELSTTRLGVTIKGRPEFTIPKAAGGRPKGGPTPLQMLKDGSAYRDLPLRGAAFTIRSAEPGTYQVMAAAQSLDPSRKLQALSFGLIDSVTRKLELALPVDSGSLADPVVIAVGAVKSGSYRLRVAAVAEDGRRGATEYEFNA